MADERMELFQNMAKSILSTPGETPPSLRTTLAEQPAQLYGLLAQQKIALPPEMKTYVTKVATNAYKVTDQDIEQLHTGGYSEDAIFEITLSVALGAGMMCLKQGLAAMEERRMRLKKIEQIKKDQPISDIRRTLSYRPDLFGGPFSACLQRVLRGESDWSVGERELFASFTASRLQCAY